MRGKSPRQLAKDNKEIVYFSGKACLKGHISKRYTVSGACVACDRDNQREERKGKLVTPSDFERLPSRKDALQAGHTQYFTGISCKHGHISPRRTKTGECLKCRQLATVAWVKKNPEKIEEYAVKYDDKIKARYVKNKDKIAARCKQARKNNPSIFQARVRARQIAKEKRTASWVTTEEKWLIAEVYALAELRTKIHGFPWHVDHIIPLRGKRVSGLHVPTNLQVIPATHNCRKANKYSIL